MKTEPNEMISPVFMVHQGNEGMYGLTKREYFAAMAMQGIIASYPDIKDLSHAWTATVATKFADELIDALNRKEKYEG